MPDIYGWTEEQREALNRLDRYTHGEMNASYRVLLDRARAEMEDYRKKYEKFVERNGPPVGGVEDRPGGRHYVFQQERLASVAKQLEGDVYAYHHAAQDTITTAQEAAARLAQVQMESFGKAAAPSDSYAMGLSFASLPEEAIRSIVGTTSNGTPLASLLQNRADRNWQDAADTLQTGVALGYGPRKIASELDGSLNQSHWKNLLLARTETMRAHHEAQRMQMLQNADLLEGWRWSAAVDSRTCPICWANHGKVFPIEQISEGSAAPITMAQHRGLEDFLTRDGLARAEHGRVDADAMPEAK